MMNICGRCRNPYIMFIYIGNIWEIYEEYMEKSIHSMWEIYREYIGNILESYGEYIGRYKEYIGSIWEIYIQRERECER